MHLLAELHRAWSQANAYYLDHALRPPVIGLSESRTQLGAWRPDDRTLVISRHLLATARWEQVVEVLRHEMAHQYVSEVLGAPDEPPHGPAFRRAADKLGVDPIVAGLAEVPSTEHKVQARIRKLLALAGSPNRNEAEVAMVKAQELILRHNLTAAPHTYTSRIIGPRKLRFQRWEKQLVALLAEHFFVRMMWVPLYLPERERTGHAAEAMGTPDNLDLAEHVHAFITASGARAWAHYDAQRTRRSRQDRNSFLVGLVRGFSDKLNSQRTTQVERGLVWRGDADLADYEARRYPRVRHRRGRSLQVTGAYVAGQAAGKDLVLHRAVERRAAGGKADRRLIRPYGSVHASGDSLR